MELKFASLKGNTAKMYSNQVRAYMFLWLQGVSWLKAGGKEVLHQVRRLNKITEF